MRARVLVVDDDAAMRDLIATELSAHDIDCETVAGADEALGVIENGDFAAVVTDLRMAGIDGLELCRRISQSRPEIPVVVLTAFGSLETAVEALRVGAYDFVTKPVELDLLTSVVERAVHHFELQRTVATLSLEVERVRVSNDLLIGESQPMRTLRDLIERVAITDVSVLIRGESGSGKEVVARALHRLSSRKQRDLVAFNCAAVPESLIESELFGHTAGAFTGASRARRGLFLEADGGTLFLDEIGDLPLALQPKLLRVLDERRVRPVGSDRPIEFDARFVAATHTDLEEAVRRGEFREDLFFRIDVVEIHVPPLRARGSDVLLLAQHFLDEITAGGTKKPVRGLTEAFAERLLEYDWPGNVRELRNVIERAVALTRRERLSVDDLPERIREHSSRRLSFSGADPEELVPLEEVERRYVRHVLDAVGGNKSAAARILGCDRKTLYRKLDHESGGAAEGD